MNQSLNALMTKLNWQLNELSVHCQEAQKQMEHAQQQIHNIEARINEPAARSLMINPELEISRLNFVTQQHELKDMLLTEFKNHQETETKLQKKIQRIKTELKMLEKYLARETATEHTNQKKIQDNAMDEWVIQKRNYDENR